MNPESETFGNAKRSALAAGYSEEYSDTITTQGYGWYSEMLGDLEMAQKAKKVLNRTLEYADHEESSFVKIAQDSAKFLAERIGNMRQKQDLDITSGGEKISVNLVSFKKDV